MDWRYHNLRLVLHRPILLNNALRFSLENPPSCPSTSTTASDEEVAAVTTCRQAASCTIASIRQHWLPTQISGWNAVWLLFQASMAPLVTVFAVAPRPPNLNRRSRDDDDVRTAAQVQLDEVLALLAEMQGWSVAAGKTRSFLARIVECGREALERARAEVEKAGEEQRKQTRAPERLRVAAEPWIRPPMESIRGSLARPPLARLQPVYERPAGAGLAYGGPAGEYVHLMGSGVSSGALRPTVDVDISGMQRLHDQFHHHHGRRQGQQQNVNISVSMSDSTPLSASAFMNQDELNAFWDQIVWGEGKMPDAIIQGREFDYAAGDGPAMVSPFQNVGGTPGLVHDAGYGGYAV